MANKLKKDKAERIASIITKHKKRMEKYLDKDGNYGGVFMGEGKKEKEEDGH